MADVHSRPVLTNCDLNNYGINGVVQVRGHGGDTVGVRSLDVHGGSSSPTMMDTVPPSSGQMSSTFKPGRWSQEEHERFLRGFELYGHKWRKVRDVVGTRTVTQVRTHAQKFFVKLKKQSTMEKPAITTPHKNSPRQMLPGLRNDLIETRKHLSKQQLSYFVQQPKAETYTFGLNKPGGYTKLESLLLAAEKVEMGDHSSFEDPVRSC